MVSKVYKSPNGQDYAKVKIGFSYTYFFFWWTGIPSFTRKNIPMGLCCIMAYAGLTIAQASSMFGDSGPAVWPSLVSFGA